MDAMESCLTVAFQTSQTFQNVSMANQAAKKAQRESSSLSSRLNKWIGAINVIYFVVRFIWYSSSVTKWTWIGYFFLVAMTYMSSSWVIAAAQEGGTSEYAMDVLVITLFVQSGLVVSDYFWLAYLVIPGYLLYLGGRQLLDYVFTPDPEEPEDAASLKRKEKAERKAARPRMRYANR